jgi:hypothetical protein
MMVLAGLLLGMGSTAYAQTAGRVLVAVGDTTALRNGIAMPLANGSEVMAGDTLRTGSNSNLQVRFTDEGVMALRADSAYKIESYQFANKTGEDKAVVSLLKGGLRAITGIIGRSSRENYAVITPTSTIGIRGTHFVLAQCANDCVNKDGSKAENGLFGGVTDGRIVVKNQSGEREFGRSEFFHVASQTLAPVPLLAPPSFLRDQLSGQSKAKQVTQVAAGSSSKSSDSATGSESSTGTSTEAANTFVSNQMAITSSVTTPITDTNLIQYVPTEQPGVVAAAATNLGGIVNFKINMVEAGSGIDTNNTSTFPFSFADSYVETGTVNLDLIGSPIAIDVHPSELTDITAFLKNPLTESGTFTEYCVSRSNCGFQEEMPSNAYAQTANYSFSKTASIDLGSSPAAGNAQWGRYTETWSDSIVSGPDAGLTFSGTEYLHWATGDMLDLASLPTSGFYAYSHVGGTRPTDQFGNVGTIVNGGTVGVTFQSGGANVQVTGVQWSMPASAISSPTNYSLNMASAVPVTITQNSYSYSFGSSTETVISRINTSASCSGCTGTASVQIAPTLFGTTGTGLAAGISSSAPVSGGIQQTASVQVYKR